MIVDKYVTANTIMLQNDIDFPAINTFNKYTYNNIRLYRHIDDIIILSANHYNCLL